MWALLYLHNWDPDGKVYPEIHGVYKSWEEAEESRKAMTDPDKYFVRRARMIG